MRKSERKGGRETEGTRAGGKGKGRGSRREGLNERDRPNQREND